jgi:hypothetical protein
MMAMLIAITPSLNASSRLELEIVKKKVVQKRIGGFALLRNRQNWLLREKDCFPVRRLICAQP